MEKRFEARESLLTALSTGSGEAESSVRAALNVCVAALVWLAVHLLLKENAANSSGVQGVGRAGLQLSRDLAATASAVFGGAATASALLAVAALHGLAALAVPLLQLLTRGGRAVPSFAHFGDFVVVYGLLQLALLAGAAIVCVRLHLKPASGFIVMCEAMRLSMKLHAYLREKIVHGVTAIAEMQAHGRLVAEAAARRARARQAAAAASASAAGAAIAPCDTMSSSSATAADALTRKRTERGERRASLRSRLAAEALVCPAAAHAAPSPAPEPTPALAPTPKRHVHMEAEVAEEAEAATEASVEAAATATAATALHLAPLAAALARFRDVSGTRTSPVAVKAAQPHVCIGTWRIELRRFAYFLFAPTLVYRDAFPRTPAVDLLELLKYLGSFIATLAFCLLVVRGMVEPTLASLSPRSTTLAAYFAVVFSMMAPAALLFLALFFAVLHCWLNAWAVALRFADRRFYGSWWTATTFGAWYRTWNAGEHGRDACVARASAIMLAASRR
jgi:hypothetical protein